MKCIQTFWTRDTKPEELLSIAAGWRSPEYHWMSWALSCLQLTTLFGDVELTTDTNGRFILQTLLRLPYSNVSLLLTEKMKSCPGDAWALAKIHAYNNQSEPFLHFDSDFYLWHPLTDTVLNAELVAQNLEKNLPFYYPALEHIGQHFTSLPEACFSQSSDPSTIHACNAGIFGGNNLSFIHDYCRLAIDFVNDNADRFAFEKAADLNFVFEQHFLYCLAKQEGIPITFLSGIVQEDPLYSHYIRFSDKPFIPFIHPVGGYKKYPHICDHVAAQLRMLYPADYERITGLLHKENRLSFIRTFYTKEGLQQRENPFFSSKENMYMRSIAALNYLANRLFIDVRNVIDRAVHNLEDDNIEIMIEELSKIAIPGKHKKWLFQLLRLENRKVVLYKSVFLSGKKQEDLYLCEVKQYQLQQTVFRGNRDETEALTVKQNPNLRLMTVSHNWTCKIPELTDQMITDKFEKHTPQQAKMALVPHITRRDIDEYYLEPIDTIILSLCKRRTMMQQIVEEMKAYFSQHELQSNYDSFHYLIINTIKRLLYLNILVLQ